MSWNPITWFKEPEPTPVTYTSPSGNVYSDEPGVTKIISAPSTTAGYSSDAKTAQAQNRADIIKYGGGGGGGGQTTPANPTPAATTGMTEKSVQAITGNGGGLSSINKSSTLTPAKTSDIISKQNKSYAPVSENKSFNLSSANKTYIAPTNQYGLGGHNIYTDEYGNQIGRDYNVLQAKESKWYSVPVAKATDVYSEINNALKESFTEPVFGGIKKVSGIDITNATQMSAFAPNLIPFTKTDEQFLGGFSAGILQDVKEQPAKNIVLFGAGASLGFAMKGVSVALSKIPKVGELAVDAFKLAETGAGIGFLGYSTYETGKKVVAAPTYEEKGAIVGTSLKDIAVLGGGYAVGSKGFVQVRGIVATRGRTELELPQGTYPQEDISKQLNLFQKNVYSELGEKPGAFHVTPDKFWKDTITPKAGTSELPGLYGSTQVSVEFSKIAPQGSYKIVPSLKDLFSVEGKPGVAYLQPKGFRYTGFVSTAPYQVGGEGKYFNKAFGKAPKQGYMDVPGMKTEIEAIARIESGSYAYESGKYYTNIRGVRVPIDVFKYSEAGKPVKISDFTMKDLISGGSSSYSLPSKYPLINLGSSLFEASKSSARAYSSMIGLSSISKGYSDVSSRSYGKSIGSLSSGIKSLIGKSYGGLSSSDIYRESSNFLRGYGGSSGRKGSDFFKSSTFVFPDKYMKTHKSKFLIEYKPRTSGSRYAPNTASIGMGIFATKIPKSYAKGFGSLSWRPQILKSIQSRRRNKVKKDKYWSVIHGRKRKT